MGGVRLRSRHWRWILTSHAVGADKAYDVGEARARVLTFGVAVVTRRGRVNRALPPGPAVFWVTRGVVWNSRMNPTRIELAIGWLTTIAGMRKVNLRGVPKVEWLFVFAANGVGGGFVGFLARSDR